MTINNEKSGELFEKYDYKNYDEDDDDDYEIDEEEDDDEDDDEDIDEYADGTISNSNTNTSSSGRSEQTTKEKKKNKKKKTGLDQNLSPDEGVGDSAEMCPPPPPPPPATTTNKKKGMILASLRPDSNNTDADAYSQVITFKRSQPPKTNLAHDEYSSVNEMSPQNNRSNMRFFRRLAGFFPN